MDNNFLPNTNIVTIFDTQLPISYEAKLTSKNLLINYEYFSAEQWVDDFHLRESINKKYKKIFYIPGVGEHSGVPIFGINDKGLYRPESLDTKTINFFCYFNENIEASVKVLRTNFPQYDSVLHDRFDKDKSRGKNLLSFNDFDQALSNSLINFVRGEDSLIRAILAGSPFIWQPYIQENGLHVTKLNAFLDHYFISLPQQLREIFLIWNNQSLNFEHWRYIFENIENLKDCYLEARDNFIKRGTGIAQIYSLFIK